MQITLEKILEGLSHETLSFMADSNHANGTIAPAQIPKVIGRINGALRRLGVKFTLSEKTIKVDVTVDRRYYTLKVDDAWIIKDPDEEFAGDVNRILGIQTPDGRMHKLNELMTHDSILLRDEGKSFALDSIMPIGIYEVTYKVDTPQFQVNGSNLEQEISIPDALLNALYEAVAAITYEGIGGPENIAMARTKWSQFEKECNEAKLNSAVEVHQEEERNKFRDRGFR